MSCPPQKRRKISETKQSRSWCYTLNNYTDEDIVRLEALECVRHVVAREKGESGTPHLQGYIRFDNNKRFSWWKNQFPRFHVEVRKGTEEQAVIYCKKDGDIVIDKGEPEIQGSIKRSRESVTMEVIEMLQKGDSVRDIFRAHPVFYFYNRRNILAMRSDISMWSDSPTATPDL